MKFLTIITLLSMLFGCSGETKLKNSILNKKPVFTMKIHGFGTRYRIHINGVEVYREKSSASQVTTSIPLNHWMRSGENSLELVVLPSKKNTPINEKSEVNAELYVHNDEADVQYRIGGFNFKGLGHIAESDLLRYRLETESFKHDEGGQLIAESVEITEDTLFDGVIEYKQILKIPNNLPLWAFFESDYVVDANTLSDDDFWALSEEFRNQLNTIRNKLIAGKVDELLPLFEERNNELDRAFYYPSGMMRAKLKDSFETDIPQLDMLGIQSKHVAYENEKNMKLASVYRANKGAAISGNYKEGSGSLKFPIMFRKQDGKWIITR